MPPGRENLKSLLGHVIIGYPFRWDERHKHEEEVSLL